MVSSTCAANGNRAASSRNGSGDTPAEAVAIFAEAPELLQGLPSDVAEALAGLRVPRLRLEEGHWQPPESLRGCPFGLLITRGVLVRRLTLGSRSGIELLGRGDMIRPWTQQPPVDTLAVDAAWQVLERCELGMLDRDFACRVARWPQVAACLLDRAVERSRILAFQQLASHFPRLESRLMALLWMLADRWGRVTPDGVLLPIRLTHSTLAELVGASRPSVSSTLKLLERSGLLDRNGGGWLLHRQPPPALLGARGADWVTARPGRRARPSRRRTLPDVHL